MKPWLIAIVLLAAVAAAGIGLRMRMQAVAAARLPRMPDVAGQPPAVVQHLVDADRLARRSPTSAAAVGALGIAYHADLFYAPAAQAYRVAVDLDPDEWRWAYYLALVHLERGEAAQAAERLRAIVTTKPDFPLAWLQLGDAEFKQARYEQAGDAYVHAARSSASGAAAPGISSARRETLPIAAYAGLGRARVAVQQRQTDVARQTLEQLIASAPSFGAAHRLLGDVYRGIGRAHDAALHLARAAALPAYSAPPDAMVDALAR
jgi:tetratricopeptide (TPR) repeat protein